MSVRRLRGSARELAPLVTSSRAEGFGFVGRLAENVARGHFDLPGTALFGAYDSRAYGEERLLGVGGLTPDPYVADRPGVGRLRHLYVLPQHRRRGVAKALVGSIIAEARPHYHVLRLRTANTRAALFYGALGFVGVTEPTATHILVLTV